METPHFEASYVNDDGCGPSERDSDSDGVMDDIDQCPNTPSGDTVDSAGCTVQSNSDSDGDGVTDNNDQCPHTPPPPYGAGSEVNSVGCIEQSNSNNDNTNTGNQEEESSGLPGFSFMIGMVALAGAAVRYRVKN